MFLEIIAAIFSIILISFVLVNKRPKGYPPGPRSFPVLGHFPYFAQVGDDGLHKLFMKWSEQYGPVLSTDFGMHRVVVIQDPKLLKEAWNSPQMCGRFHLPINLIRSGADGVQRGIIFNDGPNWVDQRRFIVRTLRDFGFGKTSMEGIIMEEAQELVRNLSQNTGNPISTQALFNAAIVNAIWVIVAGERFNHDDPKLAKLVAAVTQNLSETGSAGLIIFMHWLCKIFPNATGWNKYVESFDVTNNFLRNLVLSRKETHKDSEISDFIACYLQKVNETSDPSSSFHGEEGVKNLVVVLNDLFSAGGETTSTTLTWIMLCLAMHPEIQGKVYSEIEKILGSKLPSLDVKSSMPYMEAVLLETMRVSSVVSCGVYHNCMEDFTFGGFFLPKDTILISNLHGIHHDPAIWGDPDTFRPERFLSSDGKTVLKHDALMPFSTGKRICPGETLAKDEIFLISTCIFQKFKVVPDPLGPKLTLKQKVNGIVSVPISHRLIFNKR